MPTQREMNQVVANRQTAMARLYRGATDPSIKKGFDERDDAWGDFKVSEEEVDDSPKMQEMILADALLVWNHAPKNEKNNILINLMNDYVLVGGPRDRFAAHLGVDIEKYNEMMRVHLRSEARALRQKEDEMDARQFTREQTDLVNLYQQHMGQDTEIINILAGDDSDLAVKASSVSDDENITQIAERRGKAQEEFIEQAKKKRVPIWKKLEHGEWAKGLNHGIRLWGAAAGDDIHEGTTLQHLADNPKQHAHALRQQIMVEVWDQMYFQGKAEVSTEFLNQAKADFVALGGTKNEFDNEVEKLKERFQIEDIDPLDAVQLMKIVLTRLENLKLLRDNSQLNGDQSDFLDNRIARWEEYQALLNLESDTPIDVYQVRLWMKEDQELDLEGLLGQNEDEDPIYDGDNKAQFKEQYKAELEMYELLGGDKNNFKKLNVELYAKKYKIEPKQTSVAERAEQVKNPTVIEGIDRKKKAAETNPKKAPEPPKKRVKVKFENEDDSKDPTLENRVHRRQPYQKGGRTDQQLKGKAVEKMKVESPSQPARYNPKAAPKKSALKGDRRAARDDVPAKKEASQKSGAGSGNSPYDDPLLQTVVGPGGLTGHFGEKKNHDGRTGADHSSSSNDTNDLSVKEMFEKKLGEFLTSSPSNKGLPDGAAPFDPTKTVDFSNSTLNKNNKNNKNN